MTGSSDKDPYYGVENNNNVLVLIFLGNLNNLEESETHFGNAYPHNFTKVLSSSVDTTNQKQYPTDNCIHI